MVRKPKVKGLYDVPVEFTCRDCGNGIKEELGRFQSSGFEYFCRSCRRHLKPTEEEKADILLKHGLKLDAIGRAIRNW